MVPTSLLLEEPPQRTPFTEAVLGARGETQPLACRESNTEEEEEEEVPLLSSNLEGPEEHTGETEAPVVLQIATVAREKLEPLPLKKILNIPVPPLVVLVQLIYIVQAEAAAEVMEEMEETVDAAAIVSVAVAGAGDMAEMEEMEDYLE